jgi:hypothetical protein
MSEEIYKSIDRLRKLSPTLNKATDEAKGVVKTVEKFLNEDCGIGLPTYLSIETKRPQGCTDDLDDFEGLSIGFDKVNEIHFGIVVQRNTSSEDESVPRHIEKNRTPWHMCPRAEKLKTLPYLPRLLETIADEAERSIKSVSEVKKTIDAMMKALSDVAPVPTVLGPARAVRREVEPLADVNLREMLR